MGNSFKKKSVDLLTHDLLVRGDLTALSAPLLAVSGLVKNPKAARALAWSSVGINVLTRGARWLQAKNESRKECYFLLIEESSELYDRIEALLTEAKQASVVKPKALLVNRAYAGSKSNRNLPDPFTDTSIAKIISEVVEGRDSSEGYNNLNVSMRSDAPVVLEFSTGRHATIQTKYPRGYNSAGNDDDDDLLTILSDDDESETGQRLMDGPYYELKFDRLEDRDAFLRLLDKIIEEEGGIRNPRVMKAGSWGNGLEIVRNLPLRPLSSIILKDGQIESLINDMRTFYNTESKYVELGIPFHHGILLSGPPGTGKTSIALTAARALGLDVVVLPLSSMDVKSLESALNNIETANTVILIEEIDATPAALSRESDKDGTRTTLGVTTESLLQVLDGYSSPHGALFILTSNYPDKLDPALVRSGRIDTKLELTNLDTKQARRLVEHFCGHIPDGFESLPEFGPEAGISPADAVGVIKRHLPTPENAGEDIVAFFTKRLNNTAKKVNKND